MSTGPSSIARRHPEKQHVFAEVPQAEIERSSFKRTHSHKTTFNSMMLIPFLRDFALPGDTFNVNATLLARLATPIKAVMDNLYLETFFFFVPCRLLWDHWEEFNGFQVDPGDSTDFTIPQSQTPGGAGVLVHTLQNYLGLPLGLAGFKFNNWYCRAYNLIWNEWFRDQNLQDSVTVDLGDGLDTYGDYVLLPRGRRHDYFTSCLPWPQKGTAVQMSLGSTAPIERSGVYTPSSVLIGNTTGEVNNQWVLASNTALAPNNLDYGTGSGVSPLIEVPGSGNGAWIDNSYNLQVNLAAAVGPTIDSLRSAFALQKLLERDARGGTRYTEVIRAHFGVVSPDARLQRPEYLGGGSQRLNVTPVAQTSVSAATPQGNLAGYGVAVSTRNGFTKSFTEHGIILGLLSVRSDITYQQGVDRFLTDQTRYDLYWPALAHLGEQAVLNQEIYAQGTADAAADVEIFGYQEKDAQYRYKPSMVTGMFSSTYVDTLDVWHLADHYTALPTLGATWISLAPPMARIEAVSEGAGAPDFLLDSHIDMQCARPMPLYGVPGFTDRF